MKVTIENTTKIVNVNGVPARIWEGTTDSGIQVHCYVTRIAAGADENLTEFEKELLECRKPSAAIEAIPSRLIL